MITDRQVAFYQENGFVVVKNVLSAQELEDLRRTTNEVVAGARGLTAHNEVCDLEESHTPDRPRVRRIKRPHNVHPLYQALVSNERIVSIVTRLLGPNVRHQGGILNMKSPGYGAAIEWHQDWPFYPHTNDDLLVAGLLLDDVRPENGPVLFIPGSQRGPVYDHHADGHFCGTINLEACDIDFAAAIPALGEAGDMTVHHCRTVHGSALNTSTRARRILYHEYNAADAWPLMGLGVHYSADPTVDYDMYNSRVVAGEPTEWPRLEKIPVQLPLPRAQRPGSIYENQAALKRRSFSVYQDEAKVE